LEKRIDKLEKDLKKAIDENEKALNKKKKIVKNEQDDFAFDRLLDDCVYILLHNNGQTKRGSLLSLLQTTHMLYVQKVTKLYSDDDQQ
jgi:alpha-mannosidase